jgi:hypothetical protein
MRMWMLLTIYLLLSAFAACFVLSACLVSARISRREEAKAKAMRALCIDPLPNLTRPTEIDEGRQLTGMTVQGQLREIAHVTPQ